MRDLMMLGGLLFWMPFALTNGFVAYLLWEWLAIVSPAYFLFGFMSSVRFSMIFAAITLVLLMLNKAKAGGSFRSTRTGNLLILFLIHASLCAAFAYSPNPLNLDVYSNLAKSLLFAMLMVMFVTNRLRLHSMMIMLALGLGFHGTQEGLKFIVTGGGYYARGIPTSIMSDNNHFALAVVIGVPILFYLYQQSEKSIARMGFLAVLLVNMAAVIASRSRGGFVALAIVGLFIVLQSRRKLVSLAIVALGAGVIVLLGSESWFERIASIENAGEDASFMGRIAAWNLNTAIALANPVFGGGFHATNNFWIWELFRGAPALFSISPEYLPDYGRAAHSIYFEVLGDTGFVGLALFLSILGNAVLTRFEIVRRCRFRERELAWARDMADALFIAVVAYAVGGAAVSLGYFEVVYVIAMLLEMLKQTVLAHEREPVRGAPAAEGALP